MPDVLGKISKRPARGLWAPGNYMCQCLNCGSHFVGDKRAAHCAGCAYAIPTAPPDTDGPETDVVGEGPGFEPQARARRCETCMYWGPIPADTFHGKCRWGPPNPGGGWTRTTALDWCGKWRGKWEAKPADVTGMPRLTEEPAPRLTREPDFGREPPLERGYGFEEIGIKEPDHDATGAPRYDPRGRKVK